MVIEMKDSDLPYKVNPEKFLLIEDIKNGIYVHCRKIYNLFARALETARKSSLW
jgi:hypothetical protein